MHFYIGDHSKSYYILLKTNGTERTIKVIRWASNICLKKYSVHRLKCKYFEGRPLSRINNTIIFRLHSYCLQEWNVLTIIDFCSYVLILIIEEGLHDWNIFQLVICGRYSKWSVSQTIILQLFRFWFDISIFCLKHIINALN